MKSPAFQFYADDFIGGTCDLSAEEVGAYVRLLCYQWNKGSIAIAEPSKLSRIAGCAVSADVLAKFPGGKNARLEEVRGKQEEYRANRSEAGKQGARVRWHPDSTANSEANGSAITQPMASGMAKHSSPSPTPTPINTERRAAPERARDPLFDALAEACGSVVTQMTKSALRSCGVALAEIKGASPDVTPDEIRRRAANYRVQFEGAILTPSALAKHWGSMGVRSASSQLAFNPIST